MRSNYTNLAHVACKCIYSKLVCAGSCHVKASIPIDKPGHTPSAIGRERQLVAAPPAALHGVVDHTAFHSAAVRQVGLRDRLVVAAGQERIGSCSHDAIDGIRVG